MESDNQRIQQAYRDKLKNRLYGLLCEREKEGEWEKFLDGLLIELYQFDDEKKLKDLSIEDYDTIHVIDFNPNGILVQNNIDDLSTVKKYEISKEDYEKRPNNAKKFMEKMMHDPKYKKKIEESKGPNFELEAKTINVGQRCLLGNGTRRGEVKYVGKVADYGYGYFIGVALDEPMGDNNGSYKGKKYFECEMNYGIFVRPNFVKVGDYPPIDEFNAEEDEI